MSRLALLRHGHTAWNRAGRIQGRSDIPLDEDAKAGLAALTLPAGFETDEIWSSPLLRAVETGRLVTGREPTVSTALTEMNWGDWEGLRGEDLLETPNSGFRHIEDWGWDYHAPRGESPADVWARLQPWVVGRNTNTVAICHIGIMRVLLARATGWQFSGPAPFRIKRNRLYVLHIDDGNLRAEPEPVRLMQGKNGA